MAVNNPFTITYNGQALGGTSDSYQLLGPYIIERSFRVLRVVAEVIVVGTSASNLRSLCDTLETKFRERDKDLEIDISGSPWTFTNGTEYFNPVASIVKSGNPDTDRGLSRAYTITIEAELPADASGEGGAFELRTNIAYDPSRRRTVSFQGTFTATSDGNTAEDNYAANADADVDAILAAIDGSVSWELVSEDYEYDRTNSNLSFTRQYVELLFNQALGNLDDAGIKDHTVTFTDLSQHPAESREALQALRRVVGTYDCSLDIEQGTDLMAVFVSTVRPLILDTFQTNFQPVVFCLEDRRISYDETSKRMSVSLTFLYQPSGGDAVINVSQSLSYVENRTIDYTPVHNGSSEVEMYADQGWANIERVWTRSAVVLGFEAPQRRMGGQFARYGEIGDFDPQGGETIEGGRDVRLSGWNITQNRSQVTRQWIGDPTSESQIETSAIVETVVERYNEFPSRSGGGTGPVTP